MALVHMADGRLFPDCPQSAEAADPENDLLLNASLYVPAIELGGDVPVFGAVLRDVAVKQVHWDAADLDPPNASVDLAPRERHRDRKRRTVLVRFRNQWQVEEVVLRVPLLLPPVHVQVLAEVPLPVPEADA